MTEQAPGRLPGLKPVAVVDIGSNSVRLVIYEGSARVVTAIFNEKILSGLGRGLAATNRLDPQAMNSALCALRRFRRLAEQTKVEALYPLATAAAREAENGDEFIAAAEEAIGRPIRILSGKDEARYAAEGILAGFHSADGVVGDMGGGSLEVVRVEGTRLGIGQTLPLGGLRLLEMAEGDLSAATRITDSHLANSDLAGRCEGRPFFAIGGTWRNLARLHMEQTNYPLHVMHAYEVDAATWRGFLDEVIAADTDTLPGISAVAKSRRPLLSAGAVVLRGVIEHLKPSSICMSALGVREGYLYAQLDQEERAKDPLLGAARELGMLRSRSPAHALELVEWTSRTFETLGIEETHQEERLREAACYLADIGWRAHPDYRGSQALSIIAHAAFPAIDHPGRAFLGLTSFYRYEGNFDQRQLPELEKLIDARLLARARLVAALFRLTYVLTASMPGILHRFRWYQDPRGGFTLGLPSDLADLAGERPENRLNQFARIAEKTLRLETA